MDQINKYIKTNWVNKQTLVSAVHMNKLEDQIVVLTDSIVSASSELEQKVNKLDVDNSLMDLKNNFASTTVELEQKANKLEVEGSINTLTNSIISTVFQLTDTKQNKIETNYLFKRKVVGEFPLSFADYNDIVNTEKLSYIYPQSFAIDNITNELFVVFSPNDSNISSKRWIAVYDIMTKEYKSCFQAGNSGGEGIVIRYINNERYLFVKTTGTSLGKFLINKLPDNKTALSPLSEYNVGLYWQFAYGDGYWYIEQQGAPLGQYTRRNVIAKYDDNFNKIGETFFDASDIGFFQSDYVNYAPKRQGFTIHNGNIIFGIGGYYEKNTPSIPYSNYGIRVMDMKGKNISSAIIKSDKLIELLEFRKINCTRIENEGVYSVGNKLYSICINLSSKRAEASKGGLIIFEEMATDGYIDCSSISAADIAFNRSAYENVNFPRSSDGQLYNPITGSLIDTIDKMLDFMNNIDLKGTIFYSTSSKVSWFDGTALPNSTLVKIENCNNSTFNIELIESSYSRKYWVYGTSGSRIVKSVRAVFDSNWIDIPLADGITAYNSSTTPQYRMNESTVFIRGAVKGVIQADQLIGNIPIEYRPNGQSHQYVAPITSIDSEYTRVGRYNIKVNGDIILTNASEGEYLSDRWHCITTSYMI